MRWSDAEERAEAAGIRWRVTGAEAELGHPREAGRGSKNRRRMHLTDGKQW